MTLEDLAFLVSPAGAALLAAVAGEDPGDDNTLALLTRLRKTYRAEEARAAVELARLRVKARDKFGQDAAHLYFTRDALEQASDPRVRAYRSATSAGLRVLDACCGIGADSLAYTQSGADVTGLDIDPLRVALARLNVPAARFDVRDVQAALPGSYDLIFYDPARRDAQGKRIHDVERYLPPLSLVRAWHGHHAPRITAKLSPGVDLAQVAPYGGSVEFLSVDGDLKEATLCLPQPGTPPPLYPYAAVLITGETVYRWVREQSPEPRERSAPRRWLLEPDAALLRAGLVQDAAAAFGAWMLHPEIAYLTADAAPDTVWVRAREILDWMPFNVKKLRAYLRARGVGQVTVKKRGSPVTPETLIAQLKLKGSGQRTLVLTQVEGQPVVLVCA